MNVTNIFQQIASVDTELARRIVNGQPRAVAAFLPHLSNAANRSRLWLVVAGASAAFGGRAGRRAAQRGLLSLGFTSAVANGLMKPLFPRARPPVDPSAVPSIVHRPTSSSFPSGHSASAAAYATATAMEAPAIAAPVAALAAGVAYSRISNGVHYPSDVVVGIAIGAAVAAATTKIWPRTNAAPARARVAPTHYMVEPSPTGRGLVLVVNATSGASAHDADLERIQSELPDISIRLVDDPATLTTELATAAQSALALGVLGGDGTIGAAAAAAMNAGIPLAAFPGGTLNHFARDLGVDSVDDAVAAVREGQLVEVDVADIDGRAFLNTASFGSYSAFVESRERYENTIGKWPAVAIALAKLLVNGEPFEAVINGSRRKIWMIFIGNCAYDPPGFAPATRSRLDDGAFDVRIVDGTEPNARLRLIAAVITGRLTSSAVYTRELIRHIEIETEGSGTTLAADGETFEGASTFTITKATARLRTYAPHR